MGDRDKTQESELFVHGSNVFLAGSCSILGFGSIHSQHVDSFLVPGIAAQAVSLASGFCVGEWFPPVAYPAARQLTVPSSHRQAVCSIQ